jgi:hypothetical protein
VRGEYSVCAANSNSMGGGGATQEGKHTRAQAREGARAVLLAPYLLQKIQKIAGAGAHPRGHRASGFSPSNQGPWFTHILLGGGLGSQISPLGPQTQLAACSDRTKSGEQRGRLALVVNNYVPDAALTILLLQLLLNLLLLAPFV